MTAFDYSQMPREQLEIELDAARRQLASGQNYQHAVAPTTVYAIGLALASVCTTESDEAAAEHLNAAYPTGLNRPWTVSRATHFSDGLPNPRPCDHYPATHRHVLFER